MKIQPDTSDAMHRLVTSVVSPRSIGWISSRSEDGTDNLAPFSYFNAVSTRPPVVMFSATDLSDGGIKDTPRNVLETEAFVVNLVTESLTWQMYQSSERFESEIDEFAQVGIESVEGEAVDVARVAQAKAALECSLHDTIDVFDHTVILGTVELFHVDEEIVTDGKIDMKKIDAVGRLGGPYYTDVEPCPPDAWIGQQHD